MSLTVIEQVREHLYGIANEPDHKVRRAAYGPDAKAIALALLRELDAHGPIVRTGSGAYCDGCSVPRRDGPDRYVLVPLEQCPTRRRILDTLAPLVMSAAARTVQPPPAETVTDILGETGGCYG